MNEKLKKYISMIFSRIWIMLILAILSGIAVYAFNDKLYDKIYEAKLKIILVADETVAQSVNVYDQLRSSQLAVGDISQIIKSEAVLYSIEKECSVNQEYLVKNLIIDAVPNTRVMDISFSINTPELALKVIQSLDKNLSEKLWEVDSNIKYKILSSPRVDLIPVNKNAPVIFTILAALGGFILGGLINLSMGGLNFLTSELNRIYTIFEECSVFPVPLSNLPKHAGGVS